MCALVGVPIKWLCEVHGTTIKSVGSISHFTKNWARYHHKRIPVRYLLYLSGTSYSCQVLMKPDFFSAIFETNLKLSNFMKIRQVAAESFHAGGRTDGHDEANSRSSQLCARALQPQTCLPVQQRDTVRPSAHWRFLAAAVKQPQRLLQWNVLF